MLHWSVSPLPPVVGYSLLDTFQHSRLRPPLPRPAPAMNCSPPASCYHLPARWYPRSSPPPLHLFPMRLQTPPIRHLLAPDEPGFLPYACPSVARAASECACPYSLGHGMQDWPASLLLRMSLPCCGANRRGRADCPLLSSPSLWLICFQRACSATVGAGPKTP
jgi:hypothetical protein